MSVSPSRFWVILLTTNNVERLAQCLVAAGFVGGIITVYQPVLEEDIEKGVGGIPIISCYQAELGGNRVSNPETQCFAPRFVRKPKKSIYYGNPAL